MELQQLQHFLALAQTGSIARAADALRITPSGLSRSIRSLEDFLGLQLFHRRNRGVTISPFGEALLPHATHILDERSRAIGELEALRSLRAGRVRIAIHPVFDAMVAARIIDDFTRRFPDVELDLWSGTDPELSRRELASDFDFGLTFFPPVRDEQALVYEQLFAFPVDVCASGDDRAPPRAMSEAELLDAEWVLLGASGFRRLVDNVFRAHAIAPPRRMRLCSSMALLSSLMARGDRLTLLPRFLRERNGSGLQQVNGFIAPMPVAGGLVYRRDSALSLPALALLDAFRTGAVLPG